MKAHMGLGWYKVFVAAALLTLVGCNERQPSSSEQMAEQQERILQEGVKAVGMPGIKNFREKRLLKMIYELRDQEGFVTKTYTVNRNTGEPVFLCTSIGFAISDATGYTSPDSAQYMGHNLGYEIVTQAEPNGLFTPDVSNGYWVMCLADKRPVPVFVASEIIVTPHDLELGE